jgi:XTP/dITP diphosphohydrolase
MRKLLLASFNNGKREDISNILTSLNVMVEFPDQWVNEGPEETGSSLYDNALIKAKYYRQFTNGMILADDTGLHVNALDGFPGVRTAEWTEEIGGYDIGFQKLENMLTDLPRSASFKTVLLLLDEQDNIHTFEGELEGEMVFPARGDLGYAYCPVFQPKGYDFTLGEIDSQERSRFSHRAIALQKLCDYLK